MLGTGFPAFASFAAGSPLSPEQALKAFQTEPGLRVECVAAEPLTVAPCAMAWDERGRLFVVENRGYPTGPPPGQPPAGVIAMLEDTDDDGRCDQRTVFAAGMTFPNGIMPWRDGFIVTCAPDVLWLADTNHDGRADVRRVLLTGFSTNGSTQLRVSHPTLGPDGWIYLTSGLTGGKISCPEHPERSVIELRKDVRFHPDTLEVTTADGGGQFGQSFDDFGRRFTCFNRVQVQHVVIESRHLARNPNLHFSETLQNCPEMVPNKLMRGEGGAARLFPISANLTTADSHAGYYTAACATHVYRGDALPSGYYGGAFSCDPTANLVHYDRLEPAGATFAARRVGDHSEFLRSADNWFRPVFLATGPDGAMYVADMYRKVIEHPEYLPVDVRQRTDFESGKTMGRIWKLTSSDAAAPQPSGPSAKKQIPAFAFTARTRDLIAELGSPNGWNRDTAFRLLLGRNDPNTFGPLAGMVEQGATGPARAAALQLLGAMEGLEFRTLQRAFQDRSPGVREAAARSSVEFVRRLWSRPAMDDNRASLVRTLNALTVDPDPAVRFRCALAFGEIPDHSLPLSALAAIALRDGEDRWTRAAVLSGLSGRAGDFMEVLLSASNHPAAANLLVELGRMLGETQSKEWLAGLGSRKFFAPSAGEPGWQLPFWSGVAESIRARAWDGAGDSPGTSLGLSPRQLAALAASAIGIVTNDTQTTSARSAAISFLALFDPAAVRERLSALLDSRQPPELQTVAVRALATTASTNAAALLLSSGRWPAYSPGLRTAVLAVLLARPERLSGVLDELEAGTLPKSAFDNNRRQTLLKAKNPLIRARAEKLFSGAAAGNRQKAFDDARACLALKPAAGSGHAVFTRLCASCHRFEREGTAVGPDLFDIRNQPKESILLHIVLPEAEISPNFANYTCETVDGRMLSGLLVAETAGSITLRQAQAVEETVARSNLLRFEASDLSLMPQELEKAMTLQELADLLAYLKGEKE